MVRWISYLPFHMQAMDSVASIAPANVHRLARSRRIWTLVGTTVQPPPSPTCSAAAKPSSAPGATGWTGGCSTRGAVRWPLEASCWQKLPLTTTPQRPAPPLAALRRHAPLPTAEPLLTANPPFDAHWPSSDNERRWWGRSSLVEGPSQSFIILSNVTQPREHRRRWQHARYVRESLTARGRPAADCLAAKRAPRALRPELERCQRSPDTTTNRSGFDNSQHPVENAVENLDTIGWRVFLTFNCERQTVKSMTVTRWPHSTNINQSECNGSSSSCGGSCSSSRCLRPIIYRLLMYL